MKPSDPTLLSSWHAGSTWLGLRVYGLGLAEKEGMDKKMETTITGYIATTIGIDSFVPS